jgi:hypothetical protein
MGEPTSSCATAGIALRVSGALKPHHHDKVETPSVGLPVCYYEKIQQLQKNRDMCVPYFKTVEFVVFSKKKYTVI